MNLLQFEINALNIISYAGLTNGRDSAEYSVLVFCVGPIMIALEALTAKVAGIQWSFL